MMTRRRKHISFHYFSDWFFSKVANVKEERSLSKETRMKDKLNLPQAECVKKSWMFWSMKEGDVITCGTAAFLTRKGETCGHSIFPENREDR